MILSSELDKEMPLKDFIIGVEQYRRDRIRRIDAGDESAQLRFPKNQPPKAGAKGPPAAKAAVGAKVASPAGSAAGGTQPGSKPAVKAVSKIPTPPRSAPPGAAAAAGASAVKRPMPPTTGPSEPGGNAVKRPMPPSAPPPGAAKRPRVEGEVPASTPP